MTFLPKMVDNPSETMIARAERKVMYWKTPAPGNPLSLCR